MMEKPTKKSFVLYNDQIEIFNALTDQQCAQLLKMIFNYSSTGIVINGVDPAVKMAFIGIKITLDRDFEKYKAVAKRNRENGKHGGRPPKNPKEPKKPTGLSGNPKNPKNPGEPKKPDSDSVNDSESEMFF